METALLTGMRKGELQTTEEVLRGIKEVRREMEGKRGRQSWARELL